MPGLDRDGGKNIENIGVQGFDYPLAIQHRLQFEKHAVLEPGMNAYSAVIEKCTQTSLFVDIECWWRAVFTAERRRFVSADHPGHNPPPAA